MLRVSSMARCQSQAPAAKQSLQAVGEDGGERMSQALKAELS